MLSWLGSAQEHNERNRSSESIISVSRTNFLRPYIHVIDNIFFFLKDIKTGNNGNNEVCPNVSMSSSHFHPNLISPQTSYTQNISRFVNYTKLQSHKKKVRE